MLTDHANERVCGREVSVLGVQCEAYRLQQIEDKHACVARLAVTRMRVAESRTNGRGDEQRPPSDAVAEKARS